MSPTLELTRDLIARHSVTPADEGCQAVDGRAPGRVGFRIEHLRYGNVDNLWAVRGEGAAGAVLRRAHGRGAHRARSRSGAPIRSSPRSATACSTAAAPPT